MPTRCLALLLLLAPACAATTPARAAQELRDAAPARQTSVTGMLGLVSLDVTDVELDPALGEVDDVDDETLPFLGALWRQPLVGRRLLLGWETGFTLGWENDVQAVVIDSGTTAVVAENDFLLADAFVGASVELPLGRRLRLVAGAGPLLQFARVDAEWNDSVLGAVDANESGFGLGVYARGGIELVRAAGTSFGLALRYTDSSVEPGGDIEQVDFRELAWVFTATRGW